MLQAVASEMKLKLNNSKNNNNNNTNTHRRTWAASRALAGAVGSLALRSSVARSRSNTPKLKLWNKSIPLGNTMAPTRRRDVEERNIVAVEDGKR